jgi:hypothetical protein
MATKPKSLSLGQLALIAVLALGVLAVMVHSAMTVQIPTTASVQVPPFNQANTVSERWNDDAAKEVQRLPESLVETDSRSSDAPANAVENAELAQLLTPEAILSYVAEVRLDADGNVVLDDRTLRYLRSSLNQITTDLTAADKTYLHRVLSQGIGGAEGEKAADIVISFYDYLAVKKSLLTDAMASNNLLANPIELNNINSRIEALQYSFFDADVVEQLFYKQNMDTQFCQPPVAGISTLPNGIEPPFKSVDAMAPLSLATRMRILYCPVLGITRLEYTNHSPESIQPTL